MLQVFFFFSPPPIITATGVRAALILLELSRIMHMVTLKPGILNKHF